MWSKPRKPGSNSVVNKTVKEPMKSAKRTQGAAERKMTSNKDEMHPKEKNTKQRQPAAAVQDNNDMKTSPRAPKDEKKSEISIFVETETKIPDINFCSSGSCRAPTPRRYIGTRRQYQTSEKKSVVEEKMCKTVDMQPKDYQKDYPKKNLFSRRDKSANHHKQPNDSQVSLFNEERVVIVEPQAKPISAASKEKVNKPANHHKQPNDYQIPPKEVSLFSEERVLTVEPQAKPISTAIKEKVSKEALLSRPDKPANHHKQSNDYQIPPQEVALSKPVNPANGKQSKDQTIVMPNDDKKLVDCQPASKEMLLSKSENPAFDKQPMEAPSKEILLSKPEKKVALGKKEREKKIIKPKRDMLTQTSKVNMIRFEDHEIQKNRKTLLASRKIDVESGSKHTETAGDAESCPCHRDDGTPAVEVKPRGSQPIGNRKLWVAAILFFALALTLGIVSAHYDGDAFLLAVMSSFGWEKEENAEESTVLDALLYNIWHFLDY